MQIQVQDDVPAEVSMSPLIDCVFLLLIFFLVATMYKKQNKDIDIELPVSQSAIKLKPDDHHLVIGVDALGEVYFEGALSSLNDLHANLRQISQTDPDRRIRLDADASAPISKVVEVLDACQFRGMTNLGIRTYDESAQY